jgi:hypothetical protein
VEQDKRGIIKFLVAMAVVIAVFVVVYIATDPSLKAKVYQSRMQDAHVSAFYCFSFDMKATADPPVSEYMPTPSWGFWPVLFLRVEYVMEFPLEEDRRWAVIYIKPSVFTDPQIGLLNEIIGGDPSIKVDNRLTLPLTEEQIVTYPDAVLEIIKQLDHEQWERFYPGEMTRSTAKILARQAGIEPPTE